MVARTLLAALLVYVLMAVNFPSWLDSLDGEAEARLLLRCLTRHTIPLELLQQPAPTYP